MAINGFLRNVSQDLVHAGAFGALLTPIISATSEDLGPISQSLPPMFFGNAVGALLSSIIGNATFKGAAWIIGAAKVENKTAQKAILTAAAVMALVAALFLTVAVQNRFEIRKGEEFADSFGLGMAISMTAMIFLMKDRYNEAARKVQLGKSTR